MRSRKPCSVHRGRTVWGRGRRGEPRLLLYLDSSTRGGFGNRLVRPGLSGPILSQSLEFCLSGLLSREIPVSSERQPLRRGEFCLCAAESGKPEGESPTVRRTERHVARTKGGLATARSEQVDKGEHRTHVLWPRDPQRKPAGAIGREPQWRVPQGRREHDPSQGGQRVCRVWEKEVKAGPRARTRV